jgi:PadR family transcriptional regulator PadR
LLHELEEQGFVRAQWQEQQGRPSRRYYSLTAKGKRERARRMQGWRGFTKAVDLVLEASHA